MIGLGHMTSGMPWAQSVPELTDGVVRLRAHRPEDAERIVEQCNDPESIRWTTVPVPYGLEQADDFLTMIAAGWGDPEGVRYWAICAGDGGRVRARRRRLCQPRRCARAWP